LMESRRRSGIPTPSPTRPGPRSLGSSRARPSRPGSRGSSASSSPAREREPAELDEAPFGIGRLPFAMFESAALGHNIEKSTCDERVPTPRIDLLQAQIALLEKKKFTVLILISGVDGAGKGETVNVLNEWMDPRHTQTHAMGDMSAEERESPAFCR